MNPLNLSSAGLMAACLLFSATAATAGDFARQSFEIRGVVPVVCNATYQPNIVMQADGTIALGAVDEFCNAGHGYRVVADYSSSADPGALLVNGARVELGAGGETVLAEVSGPAILTRQLAYRPGSTPLTMLRIRLDASI